jgi:hypothetical protein
LDKNIESSLLNKEFARRKGNNHLGQQSYFSIKKERKQVNELVTLESDVTEFPSITRMILLFYSKFGDELIELKRDDNIKYANSNKFSNRVGNITYFHFYIEDDKLLLISRKSSIRQINKNSASLL